MGNKNGTGMFQVGAIIGIEVLNNHQPFVGGSEIRGSVFMQLDKPSVSALSLNVRLVGYEEAQTTYREGRHKHRRTVTVTERSLIMRVEAGLCQFPSGEVHQGRYEFPFFLTLPADAAGSQGTRMSGTYFAVKYFIEAELVRPAGIMNSAVRNALEIFVLDSPAIGVLPSSLPSQRIPLHFMCCCNTGHLNVAANVDNVNLALGEQASLEYSVQNSSTSRIKAVEISLVEGISGNAKGHGFNKELVLFHTRLEAKKISGTEPQKGRPDYQAVATNNTATFGSAHKMNVPVCANRPSFSGKIGRVWHVIRVKTITAFGNDNATIDIPLSVHGTRGLFQNFVPEVEVPVQRPADWQATVYPQTLSPTLAATNLPVGIIVSSVHPSLVGDSAAMVAHGQDGK